MGNWCLWIPIRLPSPSFKTPQLLLHLCDRCSGSKELSYIEDGMSLWTLQPQWSHAWHNRYVNLSPIPAFVMQRGIQILKSFVDPLYEFPCMYLLCLMESPNTCVYETCLLKPQLIHLQFFHNMALRNRYAGPLLAQSTTFIHWTVQEKCKQMKPTVPPNPFTLKLLEIFGTYWYKYVVFLSFSGSLASSIFDPYLALVGASGGVYALIGGYFMNVIVVSVLTCFLTLNFIELRVIMCSKVNGIPI